MVNGVLSSFVPRPGPLGRDLCFHSSENSLIEKSQTCFLNSCSKRNAIISSYSSTRGFPLLQRSGPGAARLQGPASSPPHVPAKKASEESHQSRSSASVEPQSQTRHEKAADVPSGQKQNLRNCSPPLDGSRPRKRKVPLLLPSRRNGPLILPPAPQLGYRVTAEDLDLEKRAAIQRIDQQGLGRVRQADSDRGALSLPVPPRPPAARPGPLQSPAVIHNGRASSGC